MQLLLGTQLRCGENPIYCCTLNATQYKSIEESLPLLSLKIPYSSGYLDLTLEESRVNGVLHSRVHQYQPECDEVELVVKALQNPIQSPPLRELSRSARNILVITSDHTRPVPSRITLPLLLQEIRYGNPAAEIKILIATGCHRLTTLKEMIDKFGQELVERENFINHNSRDEKGMVFKGIMPSGGELWLNSLIEKADLVVSEGFIEPHFFAGFSGGRKSILPGIASQKTVLANHCSSFIADIHARAGNLGNNPIHRDMLYAARAAGLGFIMNVVLNQEQKIINAFAGDPEAAHSVGCDFVAELAIVPAIPAEIVITSNGGYPLDQNIYQAVKGMTAAEACVKKGGVIIMVAACNDGHGGESFHRWFKGSAPDIVAKTISRINQSDTKPDQWEAQILARVLQKAHVIMVTDRCDPELINDFHMRHAVSIEAALEIAQELVGRDAKITVIPDGVSIIVDDR